MFWIVLFYDTHYYYAELNNQISKTYFTFKSNIYFKVSFPCTKCILSFLCSKLKINISGSNAYEPWLYIISWLESKNKPSTHKELHCLNLVIPITNAQRDNENDCTLSLLLQKVLGTVGTLIEPNTKKSKKIQWIQPSVMELTKGITGSRGYARLWASSPCPPSLC